MSALTVIRHGWFGAEAVSTAGVAPHSTVIVGAPGQGTTTTAGPSTSTILIVFVLPQLDAESAQSPLRIEAAIPRDLRLEDNSNIPSGSPATATNITR